MEHEYHEQQHERANRRNRGRDQQGGDGPDLASQIGNRAFTAMVHRDAERSQGAGPLDPEIGQEINAAKGGGRPLDDATKTDMEGHLGTDLSSVRVHDGAKADQLSRSVQAEAFTTGSDVFFKSGKYAPGSSDGRRLLAHELTHVVQQSSGEVGGESRVSHPDDPHEVEAAKVGDAVSSSAPAVSADRQADTEEEPEEEAGPVQASIDREEAPEEEEPAEEEAPVQASIDREAAPEGDEEAEEEAPVQASIDREEAPEDEEEPV